MPRLARRPIRLYPTDCYRYDAAGRPTLAATIRVLQMASFKARPANQPTGFPISIYEHAGIYVSFLQIGEAVHFEVRRGASTGALLMKGIWGKQEARRFNEVSVSRWRRGDWIRRLRNSLNIAEPISV